MNTTKTTIAIASWVFLSLAACDTQDRSETPAEQDTEQDTEEVDTDITHRCESVGVYDFNMMGTGLDTFEGLTVWAAAVEPTEGPDVATVTVLLETSVQDGAFDAQCTDSLQEQYYYPSYVVVFDTDNSGNCSAEDTYFIGQFYGWNEDVVATVDPSMPLETVGDTRTWGEREFCDYYVPDAMLD